MNEYNTAYLSDAELQSARNIYKANRHFYRHFNRDDDDANQRFIIDLNQFGDKDRQYMRDNHHGYRRPENWGGYGGKNKQSIQTSIFPETLDWRRQGIVGPVVNQGRCGGSWAFTTAGIIESMTKIVKGQSHQLSPQELLDCNIDNYGCSGGFLDSALMYAISKKGLAKYADYQYQGVAGTCSADTLPHYGNITDYVTVASGSDDALMDALQYGPVGVSFDASLPSFQFYKSGIYSEPSCNVLEPNHWMMCVGYGEERGVKYWILKNR